MPGTGQNILVVDDQQSHRDLISGIMGDSYKLKFAATGEECLDIIESWNPDVILMDVSMPGMGGLEACKKVKEHSNSATLSIIFLSSMSKVSERLAGYEAGGDDFVAKPFNHDELIKKVTLALENKTMLDGYKKNSTDAMSMAMTAMSQASDVGKILRFYQDSFIIHSVDELAKLSLESIQSFGVNAVLYFNANNQEYFFSSSGVVMPLEQTAIENLRDKGRIYSFSKRTMFNYGVVSALVIDMPINDEAKYGEMKDNIAILVEGAEARMNALLIELDREHKQQKNIKIIKATKVSLAALDEQQAEAQKNHESIMSDLVTDVQDSFVRLGLTEEQENELMSTMDVVASESNKLFEKNLLLRGKIESVMSLLDNTD